MMGIEKIPGLTEEATMAARILMASTESLDKYLSTAKAMQIDLSRLKYLKRDTDEAIRAARGATKVANETQKVAKESKNILDKILSVVPGGNTVTKATKFAKIISGLVAVAGLVAIIATKVITDFEIQNLGFEDNDVLRSEIQKSFNRYQKNLIDIRALRKQLDAQNLEDQRTRDRVYGLEKQLPDIRKKNNDITYEVRQGRKILEEKIKASENAINIRINKINETYRQVRIDINKLISNTQAGIIKQIEAKITKIQQAQLTTDAKIKRANDSVTAQNKIITSLQNAIKGIKPTPTDVNKITNDTIDKVKLFFNPQLSKISTVESTANKAMLDAAEAKNTSSAVKINLGNLRITIDTKISALVSQDGVLANGLVNLNQSIALQNKNIEAIDKKSVIADFSGLQKKLDDQFNRFVAENNKALNVRDLQQSKLSQDFDRKLADLANQSNLTNDQRFQQFQQQNNQALGTLSKKFDADITSAVNNFSKTSDERFNDFINQNKQDLKIRETVDRDLSRQIQKLQRSNESIEANLREIETNQKEQEKVNAEGNRKLDEMLPLMKAIPVAIAGIPLIVANAVPNAAQITQATGQAICNSANGGCLSNALNNTSNNINQNTNNQNNNLLDKLNALGQGADLALLGVINDKLGDKVPGGLSGFLTRGFKWLQLDRILNVLIFITTLHNAAMLSNNLGQTLLQAIANGLTLIGIKDESGGAIDLNAVIGNTAQGVIQGIIGTENYTSLSLAWIKASRIYQAGANVISSLTNMNDVILNGIELVAGGTAKVANALRNWRVVGEKAYEVMNPQPNLKWGIFNKLQKAQESADFILQVSQVPIELTQAATEFTNSATEFTKAIKEDPEVPPGLKIQDAAQTKEKEGVVKAASIAALVSEIDLEPDEEVVS